MIEDAGFTDETRPILQQAADRLSYDAPIHSVEDVEALELAPRWLNIKPSRFGTVRGLLETIAYAEERGIRLYGGGQFELGPGRSHIQALASTYYADNANDVAPSRLQRAGAPPDPPASPLPVPTRRRASRSRLGASRPRPLSSGHGCVPRMRLGASRGRPILPGLRDGGRRRAAARSARS